jgi:hypothetical protein
MLAPFGFLGGGGGQATIIVDAFRDRVIAAGGTFEAFGCMVQDINHLLHLEQIVTTFNLRVVAAGGTFEAVNCCQTIITDLQNINID